VKISMPIVHVSHQAIGRMPLVVSGLEVRLGPLAFNYDPAARTLSGTMPAAFVPVYSIPIILRRVDRIDVPERPELPAPLAVPAWTFDAGAPLWPGATFAGGMVYAGGDDGGLHALEAKSGRERWAFRAGGAIRTLITVAGDELYFQADDGFLSRVAAASGGGLAVGW
jgi:hypothetical protein